MQLAPGDFVVDKAYVLALLNKQFEDQPLRAKHRAGHLWNRLCDVHHTVFKPECPLCLRQQKSWPEPPLHHWTRHNDTMRFSARNLVENSEAFLAHPRHKVGDASREDFSRLCTAIREQLSQG